MKFRKSFDWMFDESCLTESDLSRAAASNEELADF